jgi:hypothetical protein
VRGSPGDLRREVRGNTLHVSCPACGAEARRELAEGCSSPAMVHADGCPRGKDLDAALAAGDRALADRLVRTAADLASVGNRPS